MALLFDKIYLLRFILVMTKKYLQINIQVSFLKNHPNPSNFSKLINILY